LLLGKPLATIEAGQSMTSNHKPGAPIASLTTLPVG
jgi:hypothetical protein